MSDQLTTTLTEAMAPFRNQIVEDYKVRAALALAAQQRLAQANSRLDHVHCDGLGEKVASIHVDLFHMLGLKYGYETVRDPDFLKRLLRDNPECRVQSRSRNTTLLVQGLRPSGNSASNR